MKKHILMLLFLICSIQANTFDKEVTLAKDYGLAYCLNTFYQTAPSNDIAVAQNMYFQAMTIGLDAYKNIQHYIKKYMSSNHVYDINPDSPTENEPVYFIMCLDMYHSKEFHSIIEKIVRDIIH